jgi:hypothetical protein
MTISFPTGHTGSGNIVTAGFPLRPEPRHLCHCGPQRMGSPDDTCARCGRYTAEQVNETWRRRAEQIGARARRRKAA